MRLILPAFVPLLGLLASGSPAAVQSDWPTIERAPPYPHDEGLPPAENRPRDEIEWYARDQRVSLEEARRRMRLQHETGQRIGDLRQRLATEEAGNFADLWLEHQPDWRIVIAFKRDPEATLRRYTTDPLFRAQQVRFSWTELEAVRERAMAELERIGLPFGGGTDVRENRIEFDVGTEQGEVEALLASGRVTASPALLLRGFPPLEPADPVTPEAARLVRIFPQQRHRLIAETSELNLGRIFLRDGCLRLDRPGDEDPLAYFAAESALKISLAGRLAIYTRGPHRDGQAGHVGERMVLGGGAGREITDPTVLAPVHAACGPGKLVYVGNPHSHAAFRMNNVAWQIDARAAAERISREEAFRRIRAEWAAEDARLERWERGHAD